MNLRVCFLGIACILVLLTYTDTQAQQPTAPLQEPKTKLESFQRQTGTVVIKGYSEMGKIGGLGSVSVDCMEFIDASTRRRQMGIVIEVTESGRLEKSDRSFIDYDEIDPLLKGIDYIANVKTEATRLGNFEAIYKTKGEFSVITFSSSGKVDAAVKSGYALPATAYLSLKQLGELRNLISRAKQKLDSLK
jgi:hypothetical protein